MDNITMIEKLREKSDISYKTANEILEGVGWDVNAAEEALRKEGLIREETAMITTEKTYSSENSRKETGSFKAAVKKAARWFGNILSKGMDNSFCIDTQSGKHFAVPVTIMAVLLIAGVTFVPILLLIAFFCGCRFSFSGPDLGKEKINDEMSKIRFTAGK